MLLWPYLEKQALYEMAEGAGLFKMDTDARICNDFWWRSLDDEQKKVYSSVTVYRCPASNGSYSHKERTSTRGRGCRGPTTDYVTLIAKQPVVGPNDSGVADTIRGWNLYNAQHVGGIYGDPKYFYGPFRVARIDYPPRTEHPGYTNFMQQKRDDVRAITGWGPRDSMSWWTDGASNQLIFGEKHIPSWALHGNGREAESWNGGYQVTEYPYFHTWMATNIARHVLDVPHLFATSPNDPLTLVPNPARAQNPRADVWPHLCLEDAKKRDNESDESYEYRIKRERRTDTYGRLNLALGSSHPAVAMFARGDGSVYAISKQARPNVIFSLTRVDEGTTWESVFQNDPSNPPPPEERDVN
jgi:hypothetical protein